MFCFLEKDIEVKAKVETFRLLNYTKAKYVPDPFTHPRNELKMETGLRTHAAKYRNRTQSFPCTDIKFEPASNTKPLFSPRPLIGAIPVLSRMSKNEAG